MFSYYYNLLFYKLVYFLDWVLKKLPQPIQNKITKVIYNTRNNQDTILIYENLFFRWLNFGDAAIQSKVCKFNKTVPCLATTQLLSFSSVLYKLNNKPDNISVILFGLGGGDILRYYAKNLKPNSKAYITSITAIEKSKEIINLAKKYFYINKSNKIKNVKINIQQIDAFEIILTPSQILYNIIVVDFFTKLDSAASLKEKIYINNLHQKLTENGILIINLLISTEQQLLNFINNINYYFKDNILIIKDCNLYNMVIFAFKKKNYLDFINNYKNIRIAQYYIKNLIFNHGVGYFAQFK